MGLPIVMPAFDRNTCNFPQTQVCLFVCLHVVEYACHNSTELYYNIFYWLIAAATITFSNAATMNLCGSILQCLYRFSND